MVLDSATRPAPRWLQALASLKLTLAILAVLLAATVAAIYTEAGATWLLAPPLALFAANLACAVIANPVFRRQTALLAFHLALIAIVLLAALGRMTYLRGEFELTEGATFDGRLAREEAGPWHPRRLQAAAFENLGMRIEYAAGIQRGKTYNAVRWMDAAGRERTAVIGDIDPLVLHGYRFYTTPQKGFAPIFTWQPFLGPAVRGSVHLPSYPALADRQEAEWSPPGAASKLKLRLVIEDKLIDPARASELRLPKSHRLYVKLADSERALAPGERLALPDGVLVYDGLRSWMGYMVSYDQTLPWLLSACALAIASLAWHYWRKFAREPWLRGEGAPEA